MPNPVATIRKAAQAISEHADCLKECSTVDGVWDAEDYATEAEYQDLMKLVRDLRAILGEEA